MLIRCHSYHTKEERRLNSKERVICAIYFEEPDRVPFSVGLHPALQLGVQAAWGKGPLPQFSDIVIEDVGPPRGWTAIHQNNERWVDEWGVLRSPRRGQGTIDWFENCPISSVEKLDSYEFPDPYAPGRLDDLDKKIAEYGETHCIFGGIGWLIWERAWILRGMSQLMIDMYRNPKFVDTLLDRITEYDIAIAKQIIEREIDIFHVGDDYGSRQGPLLSPWLWRRFIKPRLRKIFAVPLRKSIPVSMHSDGNIRPIIEDLVEVGVRILNPVSPLEMNPEEIRAEFGDKLCFWGTADIHRTIPFGTPSQIIKEIRYRMATIAQTGGLIYHARLETPDTPPKNVVALIKALKRYGRYPQR